ncbi:MAG TPA: ABC transporter permease [Bacteroidales bacterium]|jgi:ABC-type antimicrobial peptide transport system, permease component
MFDRDRWQEIFIALKQNKLRTVLTALGVAWGIFMLVIMLGAGNGLHNGVYDGMGGFATNSVFVWAQSTTVPYKGFKKGRWYSFNNSDTKAILDQVPEVEILAPRLQARFWQSSGENNVVRGLKTGAFSIFGDYPDYNRIDPYEFLSGRFIDDEDIKTKRKVAVIGTRVRDLLFEPKENPIGQYIRIKGVYFQVIGVFRSQHKGGWAEWQEQCVVLPLTTLQQTYNYGEDVGWFAITAKKGISALTVEDKVKALLKSRHFVSPDDKEAIGSDNVEKEFQKISNMFMGISMLVWIVGIGTLLAGVIGVSNIMLIIVKERTKEIGIQRAIGAQPIVIISQIITESIFLTTLAGYVGLVCGVGVVELINYALVKAAEANPNARTMFTRPEVDFGVAMIALSILIVCGALAGLVPARRAVKVKPIDALRYE